MSSTASGSPLPHPAGPAPSGTRAGGLNRAELRGRAIGSSVLAFFAFGWTVCGTSDLHSSPLTAALLTVAALASLAVFGFAVQAGRQAAHTPAGGDRARGKAAGRRFGLIVTAEWIGIFAAVRALDATGHPHLIAAVIALGVGIHFFPLARLFSVPVYDVTGAVLCLIALATLLLAPLTGSDVLWTLLPGLGSALGLYATCAHVLRGVLR
ncbi:hypothetical protein [Kitasatospora sp. NBC_01302]|uniref:hypothetical protein n=1 Tax=Kitasatospora sp. NBC_01302 TaxID=2903575 RepID=UPI002E1659DF|nr:hypothetical protein OG294_35330 [Kitasatospora sp. NBC_01302]